jgi:hypothetical protein
MILTVGDNTRHVHGIPHSRRIPVPSVVTLGPRTTRGARWSSCNWAQLSIHSPDCRCDHDYLSSLPHELLAIIWDKMQFGDSDRKADLDSLRLSCKALQQALCRYRAALKLRGSWQPDQLAGI